MTQLLSNLCLQVGGGWSRNHAEEEEALSWSLRFNHSSLLLRFLTCRCYSSLTNLAGIMHSAGEEPLNLNWQEDLTFQLISLDSQT